MASVPAQPIEEIDEEILGANGVGALGENGSGEEEETDDDHPNTPPPATIPVSQAKKVGAINAQAVQSNRRRKAVLDKKRAGEKNIPWGEKDACLLYDDIISVWPPQMVTCHVKRTTGDQIAWYLQSQPKNGRDLYEAIRRQCHVQQPEMEYDVTFRDLGSRVERGRGSIRMPSTEFDPDPPVRETPPQAPPQAVPAAPAPPPPPPPQYPQHGHEPPWRGDGGFPQHQPPMYPQRGRWGAGGGGGMGGMDDPPPRQQPQATSGSADPVVVMQLQRQLSEMAAQLQSIGAHARDPMAQQLADIQAQLDRMTRTPNAPPPVVAAPAPQVVVQAPTPPAPVKMPEVPPGYALTMMNGLPVLVPLTSLGLAAPPAAAPVAAPLPILTPQPVAAAPPPPPEKPLTPAEQFASTIGMVKSALEVGRTIQSIMPTAQAAAPQPIAEAPETPAPVVDESPTKLIKIGDVNVMQNVEDGSMRLVDTLVANAPGILSWIDRQRNEYLTRQAVAQGQQPPAQPQSSQIGAPTIPTR